VAATLGFGVFRAGMSLRNPVGRCAFLGRAPWPRTVPAGARMLGNFRETKSQQALGLLLL
jgi:hypothetical protein